jgi:hypothetical protein
MNVQSIRGVTDVWPIIRVIPDLDKPDPEKPKVRHKPTAAELTTLDYLTLSRNGELCG